MNTYYLNIEEDGFGDWGDIPEYKKSFIIKKWVEIAEEKIVTEFPNTKVKTIDRYQSQTHPEADFIDGWVGERWPIWLEWACYAAEYGEVQYKKVPIYLTEQAYQTCRVMSEYPSYLQYQGDGKTYIDEWKASGIKHNGEEVFVYWHFEVAREGVEDDTDVYLYGTLPEDYNWDDIYKVDAR